MASQRVVDTLNALLAAEYASILPRIRQSDPFVSLSAADDRAAAQSLMQQNERHEGELSKLIMELRGSPVSPAFDIDTTSYHYVTLEYLVPQIIQSVQGLIAAYTAAGATGHTKADALITQNLADYQRQLKPLEKMHSNLVSG